MSMSDEKRDEFSSQDSDFPKGFFELYSSADVKDSKECLTVLLHTFLLEVGFRPKDLEADALYKHMPDNWKHTGVYKILYNHESMPESYCWVTFVPMYNNLMVHGNTESKKTENGANINLSTISYVNTQADFSDPSTVLYNRQVKELSRCFKDGFCFPLQALLQDDSKPASSFGLNSLIEEAKLEILKFLPLESVLTMSEVNKEFHNKTKSSYLWKHLFKRDYGLKCRDLDKSGEEDWKKIYKMEYLKRKYRADPYITGHYPPPDRYLPYPFPFPDLFDPDIDPVIAPFGNPDIDIDIDLDPPLQQAFPFLRPRFRSSILFAPYPPARRNPFL